MASFQTIIGLEVHIELKTNSKMFCGCKANHFGQTPNTLCCPVCLGLPGSLPVPNKKAIEWTILLGLALGCKINQTSFFERKNYFYPDLPKGYQISQYQSPFCQNGKLDIEIRDMRYEIRDMKRIGIQRVHLEEDTAKLIHQTKTPNSQLSRKAGSRSAGQSPDYTLIDFNRSGVPLVEIVSDPNLSSANEAKAYLQKIQQVVRALGISSAAMEEGSMRCEPNVNVRIFDKDQWVATPIVEIKNINSFKFVQKAIDYEVKRQIEEYQKTGVTKEAGNKATRGFDEQKEITYLQRQKEEADDYRYFPEPDIPPIRWTESQLSVISDQLSAIELPDQKQERFIKEYGLNEYQARILIMTKKTADYFENSIKYLVLSIKYEKIEPKTVANWIINKKVDIDKISSENLVRKISQSLTKKGLPTGELTKILKKVLKDNKKAVEEYKKGKHNVVEFLLGQVMRETRGKTEPNKARKKILGELKN